MEKRAFGPGGPMVPVVGQGTWRMENDDRAECIASLRNGLDLGLTHVDTAELYGHGVVEEMVAEVIDGRRDEVFLVSKVMPSHASHAGTVKACEQSLRRLRTDHLDVYLLHWPGEHPLEATFKAFEALQRDGKIRAYGVSNFGVDDLGAALAVAGPGKIACNQVLYHLGERSIEHGVVPWCARHGVSVVAYSPFGAGRAFPPSGAGARARAVLDSVARAHGVSVRQVALRFLLRVPGSFVIPKAAKAEHMTDNAAAGALALTHAELAAIDEAFPSGDDTGELKTL